MKYVRRGINTLSPCYTVFGVVFLGVMGRDLDRRRPSARDCSVVLSCSFYTTVMEEIPRTDYLTP